MRDISGLVQQATSQHGLLTTSQLRALGFSRSEQRTLIRTGVLRSARPGVLALAGSPDSFEQRLLAVVLATGATASHLSALRLHGHGPRFSTLEVMVPYPADCGLEGVAVHRSKTLELDQVEIIDGIAVTTLARTLVDVSGRLPTRHLGRIVDHAAAEGGLDVDALRALRRTIGVGRRGITRLDAIIERCHDVVGSESGPEVDLRRLLRDAGLPEPVAQFALSVGGDRYRLDLAYPLERIAIEYDGYLAHSGHRRFEEDRRRQNNLVRAGWGVLRFTARDLREDRHGVAALVRAQLALRRVTDGGRSQAADPHSAGSGPRPRVE